MTRTSSEGSDCNKLDQKTCSIYAYATYRAIADYSSFVPSKLQAAAALSPHRPI